MQKKNKYIARVDIGSKKYWVFRFARHRGWASPVQVLFTDKRYGSKQKALNAAVRYRNKYLRKINKVHRLSAFASCIRHRHSLNSSGVIGVNYQINYSTNSEHPFWKASGMHHGKSWRRGFSVLKYGYKGAFKWACYERCRRHGPLSILVPVSKLPCSPGVPWVKYKLFANGKG